MHPVSTETLQSEIERLEGVLYVCEQHGEADGATAARSQLRAFRKELESREA